MARGRDAHQAHLSAVAALGRNLSRRASSRCELCEDRETLTVVEVPPAREEPAEDRALLLCPRCSGLVNKGLPKRVNADELRFLEQAVWSDLLPAKLAAVRLTRKLAAQGVPWAQDILEGLWIDEDTEALLG